MHEFFAEIVKGDDAPVEAEEQATTTRRKVVSYTNVFALQRSPNNDQATPAVTDDTKLIYDVNQYTRVGRKFFKGSCLTGE